MINTKKIFICTTEQSGDNISSEILKRISNKHIIIDGVCGSKSKKYLRKKFFDIKEFKSMGLFEIIISIYKYLNILIEKYPDSHYGIKAKIFIEEKNLKNKKLDDIEIDRIKRFIELHKETIGIPEFSKKIGNYLINKSDDQLNQNNFDEAKSIISFKGVMPPVTLEMCLIAIILVLFVINFLISSTCISRS